MQRDVPDTERLEQVLLQTADAPAQQLLEIERARRALSTDAGLIRDLERVELRFLQREAARAGAPETLRARVEEARNQHVKVDLAGLLLCADDDAAALFDLAELRAECMLKGFESEAEAAGQALDQRLAAVTPSDRLEEEARERWAALSTEEEDLELDHRIHVTQQSAELLGRLAERTGRSLFRRLSRRLHRRACDLGLQLRMESVLGRSGTVILETASFLLLLVIMALLLIEGLLLDPQTDEDWVRTLLYTDGAICLFFIAEFGFKLALAPAKLSWFLRNFLIDLLPAIPAALWLLPDTRVLSGQENAAAARIVRVLRIGFAARYVNALRPLLRMYRFLLFLIRGMDGVVARFSPIVNRNFVFFEEEPEIQTRGKPTIRSLLFRALRREQVLLADMARDERFPKIEARAGRLISELATQKPAPTPADRVPASRRDIPVEEAIEFLHALRPEEVGMWLPRRDVLALDRLIRVINAPVVRLLPMARRLRLRKPADTPEQRVAAFAGRIASWLEQWQGRLLYIADLHGILTGPQVLDRVASAMVRFSQRPAVRLLLFGALFTLARLVLGDGGVVGSFLGRFVATPLVVLGTVCLVVLLLGRWLKRLAGEAADSFKLTSEAHFIGLLHLVKRRHEDRDLEFLARRIFRWELAPPRAVAALRRQIASVRRGRSAETDEEDAELTEDVHRVTLLYLHFLDGALLHESDIKSTEQLLANLSMENIRYGHLGFVRKDKKRLRRLSLVDGPLLGGPYLWFRFITESIAVESAKRITEYNRNCLTLEQRRVADPRRVAKMEEWVQRRRSRLVGRTLEKLAPPGHGALYSTTEFNALDFLAADPDREQYIERVFGPEILELLRADRRAMVREIFGTRPLHELPRSRRSVNFYRFYQGRLSSGRFLLLPLYLLVGFFRTGWMVFGRTRQIVREILRPHLAANTRVLGVASFEVAERKILRMKAPGLLEAMRTRVLFDPAYCGAPATWSEGQPFDAVSELERDMDFLHMKEREREELRELAARTLRRVQELQSLRRHLPPLAGEGEPQLARRLGERAVTVAYVTDRNGLRSLFRGGPWAEDTVPLMESRDTRVPGLAMGNALAWLLRGGRRHPVDRWLDEHLASRKVSRRGRRNFKRAWRKKLHGVREHVGVWLTLAPDRLPFDEAVERARAAYQERGAVARELVALRTVQSLSVLDVRNYRSLVFKLGGYELDGEDSARAHGLP